MAWLSKGMTRDYRAISPETRHSFYLAFGTTPDMQVELENFYRKQEWCYVRRELDASIHLPRWV
jgi:hypothetical protein